MRDVTLIPHALAGSSLIGSSLIGASLIGSWAVLRRGATLVCFATREEAAKHAAALSVKLAGEELIVAWIAGVFALKSETAEMAAEREALSRKWGGGPRPHFLNLKGAAR